MTVTLQEALTEAGTLAETIYRQVWVCECGGNLEPQLNPQPGSHLVARVFGAGDFVIDDEQYVDAVA